VYVQPLYSKCIPLILRVYNGGGRVSNRGGGAGQRERGPTMTVKLEKWISRCKWYSWGPGGLKIFSH